ncbi:MAG TPA: YaaR family protein [Clostridiaceae bacterium]|nr:YaaR family protein [Clostridiaceae bacterium]
MKINQGLNELPGLREPLQRDPGKKVLGKSGDFHSNLMHAEEDGHNARLKDLAKSIEAQGEKLAEKLDIAELRVYKRLISEFLSLALRNSHKFTKENFLDRRGRHRAYAIIKKINSELDELTSEILANEKNNVKILEKIDGLKGLIFDLIL